MDVETPLQLSYYIHVSRPPPSLLLSRHLFQEFYCPYFFNNYFTIYVESAFITSYRHVESLAQGLGIKIKLQVFHPSRKNAQ